MRVAGRSTHAPVAATLLTEVAWFTIQVLNEFAAVARRKLGHAWQGHD